MAAFVSTSSCSLSTLAAIPRSKGPIPHQKSISLIGGPLFGALEQFPKIQFSKNLSKSSPRSRCFSTAISCSIAQPETLQIVQSTIAKQLSIEARSVTPATKFADLGADSLDTVEIMMALEEQFGVSIGEGGAENIASAQDAADIIKKVKAAEA